MTAALSLQDVRVRFGGHLVVDGVSLAVRRGEVVGLLGANGSGKSTTLAVAAGLIDPAGGTVWAEGVRRSDDPAGFATRVGFMPQDNALYDELTAADNLTFFGQLYGLTGRDLRRRVARALSRVGMASQAGGRVGTFSGGMKQRINLAATLLHDPPVLLLDEPTAAVDPAGRDALFADLGRLRDDGHAILLSTHRVDEAEQGCDRVAALAGGKLTAVGTPRDLFRPPGQGRAALYGHLRTRPPQFLIRMLRDRLGPGADLEVTGRRLRLAAATSADLGRALARVLAEGVEVESFHTPRGTLERVLHHPETGAHGGAIP